MVQCPRCHRANPSEALFCHFDGAELRRAAGRWNGERDVRLPHEFVFPSGRRCRTYDDLVQECQNEWEVARDLLSQGVFQQFLAGGGRMDLARAAQKATTHSDADIALDTFLTALPAKVESGPRLDLTLRRLDLGTLHVGETRHVRLAVLNQGKGFLHGTLTVADGTGWLRLGEGRGNGQCLIRTAREQEITVRVDTRGLAAPHQYSTKLTVITNGGIVEVPVGLNLEVQPFSHPPFEGAGSPREMAERMRTHPKLAVPLLESGEIGSWFEANGWTYPVSEPTAHGVAAVQQFFEGMGLSKPPPVQINAGEISQSCLPGEVVSGQLTLRTSARKWVYARVESDAPWLRLTAQNVSGPQQAAIAFEAHSQHLQPGRVHEANLQISANAGQVFRVAVHLEVRQPSGKPDASSARKRTDTPQPVLVGATAGMVARLLLILPMELSAGLWLSPETIMEPAALKSHFLRHFVLLTWWVGAIAGPILLHRRGRRGTDLVYGLIAGGVAGLVGSATLACVVPELDWLPRFVWHKTVAEMTWSSTTLARVALAVVSWASCGALAGFVLGCAGQGGARILRRVANALAWLFVLCGLKRTAARFMVR